MKQREYSLIARSYAEALFRSARTQGQTQRVKEDCRALAESIRKQPRFLIFLESPQIATEAKNDLILRVFGDKLSPLLMRLLAMLVRRERVSHLVAILERFEELAEQAEGIYPASVTSAIELGYKEKLELRSVLEKYTRFRLNIRFHIEPNLIGGLIFRCRDLLIDSSLHNSLENLRRRLATTSINGSDA